MPSDAWLEASGCQERTMMHFDEAGVMYIRPHSCSNVPTLDRPTSLCLHYQFSVGKSIHRMRTGMPVNSRKTLLPDTRLDYVLVSRPRNRVRMVGQERFKGEAARSRKPR